MIAVQWVEGSGVASSVPPFSFSQIWEFELAWGAGRDSMYSVKLRAVRGVGERVDSVCEVLQC